MGRTGYEIDLPHGFLLTPEGDSAFTVYPVAQSTVCRQSLRFSFGGKGIKVPGTRPTTSVPATLAGHATTFSDFGRTDSDCLLRTGGAQLDSLCVQVTCGAAAGEPMERLFAVALSLRKSPAGSR
jgi:hypothetical protein